MPLTVVDAADEVTLYVYDVIDSFFGVQAESFARALADAKGKAVHVRINSPGGDVFDARAMQTALRQYNGPTRATIDGLAASAATYLALGAKQVEMADGAFFMIHNAWTWTAGNKNDLVELAALLEKIDASLVEDYAARTGKPRDQITAWMDDETWFTAAEAKEHGFIDSIIKTEKAEASARVFDLSAYNKAPSPKATVAVLHDVDAELRAREFALFSRQSRKAA